MELSIIDFLRVNKSFIGAFIYILLRFSRKTVYIKKLIFLFFFFWHKQYIDLVAPQWERTKVSKNHITMKGEKTHPLFN